MFNTVVVDAVVIVALIFFLIVTHEFGHFIAAKIFGVRVEEFGIGFPPTAFDFGKIGETEYTLNWIPLGGFVRLRGEDEGGVHGHGSFIDAKWWKRAIILLAGVFCNLIVAWGLLSAAFWGLPQSIQTPQPGVPVELTVSYVVPGSPAEAAGIQLDDQITGMTDAKGNTLTDFTPSGVVSYVEARGGQPITVNFLHDSKSETVTVTPADAVVPGAAAQPAIGVGLVLIENVGLPWKAALEEGFSNVVSTLQTVCSSLWVLITGAFHGAPDLSQVVGPVGLVVVASAAAQNGVGQFLAFSGLVAVNLAIVNLIPIPALDGGRLVIVLLEAASRRKMPKLGVELLNTIGIALIIILMITVTYHDIARLIT